MKYLSFNLNKIIGSNCPINFKFVFIILLVLEIECFQIRHRRHRIRNAGGTGKGQEERPSQTHRLIKTSTTEKDKWASQRDIEDLLQSNQSYLDVTDLTSIITGRDGQANKSSEKIDFPIPNNTKFEAAVTRRMNAVQRERIQDFLKEFSSYASRMAINALGKDAAMWLYQIVIKPLIEYFPNAMVYEQSLEEKPENASYYKQKNIIVRIEGNDEILKNEIIIVGAHIDSISIDGKPCLTPTCLTREAPGADDNASGVSAILEALRALLQTDFEPKRTIEFHFYGGGEFGLRGSLVMASKYYKNKTNMVGMLNFDMVGHGPPGPIAIHGHETHPVLSRFIKVLVKKYLKEVGFEERAQKGKFLSDHVAWTTFMFPAAYVSEANQTPKIHSTKDTIDTLDTGYIAQFAKLAVAFLVEYGMPATGGDSDFDAYSSDDYDESSEVWLPLRPNGSLAVTGESAFYDEDDDGEERFIIIDTSLKPVWMTEKEIKTMFLESELINFLDITDMINLQITLNVHNSSHPNQTVHPEKVKVNNKTFPQIPKEIRFKDITTDLISMLRRDRVHYTMDVGLRYTNRFGNQFSGKDFASYFVIRKLEPVLKRYTGLYSLKTEIVSNRNSRLSQPNVVVRFEGTNEQMSEELIILGAHIDSLSFDGKRGHACLTSQCLTVKAPGADDNLSGTAVMLEALTVLVESGFHPSRSIEFHFYGGSEYGLLGSATLSEQYLKENIRVVGMLNMDLVGYSPEKNSLKISILKEGSHVQIRNFIKLLANTYTKAESEIRSNCEKCLSDWLPWTTAGYPAGGTHEWNITPFLHTENDTLETINIDYMMEHAKLAVAWCVEFGELVDESSVPPKTCSGLEYHAQKNMSSVPPPVPMNNVTVSEKPKPGHQQKQPPSTRKPTRHIVSSQVPDNKTSSRIILTEIQGTPKMMTMEESQILRKRQNYIDITSNPSARTLVNNLEFPEKLMYSNEFHRYAKKFPKSVDGISTCVKDLETNFPNRYYLNPDGKKVSQWVVDIIERELEKSNYAPSCYSVFEKSEESPQSTVIFRIVGADKQARSNVIVFGAHLDTWNKDCAGHGSGGKDNCKSPGADDNGSGICLLLAMVHTIVSASFIPKRTIEFHWYTGSEAGLLGSYSVASDYKKMDVNMIGMLNFDSIGYMGSDDTKPKAIGIQSKGVDDKLTRFIQKISTEYLVRPF